MVEDYGFQKSADGSQRSPSASRKHIDIIFRRRPLVGAFCYEGYSPTDDIVEDNVFDLYQVAVADGFKKGTGTLVVQKALEVAKARGFSVGRSFLLDPRMVTIMTKMQAQEIVGEAKYHFVSPQLTEELLASQDFLSAEQATDFLNQSNGSAESMAIDCVFEIR